MTDQDATYVVKAKGLKRIARNARRAAKALRALRREMLRARKAGAL